MKNILITLFLCLATLSEASVITRTELQVDILQRHRSKKISFGDSSLASQYNQHGVALTPSLFFNEKYSFNGSVIYNSNATEKNHSSLLDGWNTHSYSGHSWSAHGQIRSTYSLRPTIQLVPGIGYYYDFRREGYINDNSKIWQGSSYGPYVAVAMNVHISQHWSLSIQERYVFARLRRSTRENDEKTAYPRYNDRIYSNVIEIAYELLPHAKLGLGYEYEQSRAKDRSSSALTVTTVNSGKIFVNYSF